MRPWYVVEVGEKTRKGELQLKMKKFRKTPRKGNANLYLKVARAADADSEQQIKVKEQLDLSLWQQLPALLASKILLDHLPFDQLILLANGDSELTAAVLAQPLRQGKCALFLPDQSLVLHNFGPFRAPHWRRLQLHPQGCLLAVSPFGLLFYSSHDSSDSLIITCHSLMDGQSSVLEPVPAEFDLVLVDACKVIHVQHEHPYGEREDVYKLVILYAACTKALVYDSPSGSWKKPVIRFSGGSWAGILFSAEEYAIERCGDSDAQVILPADLYCRCPLTEIRTVDSTYTFLLAAVGKPQPLKPGSLIIDLVWEGDDETKGIHKDSPVVFSGLKLDNLTGEWENVPGPTQQACGDIVLSELRLIGSTDCLGVFANPQGRLVICLVEPWSWWIAKPVRSWCYGDNRTIYAYSP